MIYGGNQINGKQDTPTQRRSIHVRVTSNSGETQKSKAGQTFHHTLPRIGMTSYLAGEITSEKGIQ